jgi:hypothetical protein
MKNWNFRRFVLGGLALAGACLVTPHLSHAAGLAAENDSQNEVLTQEIESLVRPLAGVAPEGAVFTDLGEGFYSVSIPLSPQLRERLLQAIGSADASQRAQAPLTVISVGQAPALPPSPVTTTHGALADTTFPYTYWIITVNLGNQRLTKATSLKLTGPGLKFNRSTQVAYGANGIWGIGYRPGGGVVKPGIYTLQGTVNGGGSITTKFFAINP